MITTRRLIRGGTNELIEKPSVVVGSPPSEHGAGVLRRRHAGPRRGGGLQEGWRGRRVGGGLRVARDPRAGPAGVPGKDGGYVVLRETCANCRAMQTYSENPKVGARSLQERNSFTNPTPWTMPQGVSMAKNVLSPPI